MLTASRERNARPTAAPVDINQRYCCLLPILRNPTVHAASCINSLNRGQPGPPLRLYLCRVSRGTTSRHPSTAASGSSGYHARSSPPHVTQLARCHPLWRPSRAPLIPPIPSFSTEAALSESPRPQQDRTCPQRMSGPARYPQETAGSHCNIPLPEPTGPHPTILHASQRHFHAIIPGGTQARMDQTPCFLYDCPPDVLIPL
jgi:hypothetical protein